MLINANILIFERMIIDFATQFIIIDSCRDIIVPINSRARSKPIKRVIKSLARIVLLARSTL